MRVIWIGAAGFLGTILRYWVDGWISRLTAGGFPWGTFAINVSGCFLIGLLTTILSERVIPHPTVRIAVTFGFIGSYTTFSTFAYETLHQLQNGATKLALVNVICSVILGIGAAWVGVVAGSAL